MLRRYPLEPFFAVTGWPMSRVTKTCSCNGPEYRRRQEEGVTELIADRLAHAAGRHPFEIWPEMRTDAIASADRRDEQRLIVRREQWAASSRRRWATDPAYRAYRAEYMRAYRAEAREVIAAQKRRWREANRERVRQQNREANRRMRARRKVAA